MCMSLWVPGGLFWLLSGPEPSLENHSLGVIPGPVSLIVNPPARSKALRDLFAVMSVKRTIYSPVNVIQLVKEKGKGLTRESVISRPAAPAASWWPAGRSEGGGWAPSAGTLGSATSLRTGSGGR